MCIAPSTRVEVVSTPAGNDVLVRGAAWTTCGDVSTEPPESSNASQPLTDIGIWLVGVPGGPIELARADVPFDAMVAATATDGPVLLVPVGCRIPVWVSNEISRLGPDLVVGLGGPTVICDHVLEVAARQPDFSN